MTLKHDFNGKICFFGKADSILSVLDFYKNLLFIKNPPNQPIEQNMGECKK